MTDDEIANAADAVWEDLRAAMAQPGADRPAMIAALMALACDLAVAEYGVEAAQRYFRANAAELPLDYVVPTHEGGRA